MNPKQAMANRTARLVREAHTPVYSTETVPVRPEHLTAVETDTDSGRFWSHMPESEITAFIDATFAAGNDISDIDHSAMCWCQR